MLKKHLMFAVIYGFLFSQISQATVIVHSLNEQKVGLHTTLGAKYAESSSTVSKKDYDADFRLSHNNDLRQWLLFGNLGYSAVNGNKSEDSKLIHLRYIHKNLVSDLNFEGFVQHESDDFALLSSRELVGAGLALLKKTDDYAFHTMLGIMHEQESHLTDSSQDKQLERMTFSSQLQWYFVNKAQFTSVIYYQPAIDEIKNYRATLKANYKMPINNTVDLVIGYSWQYNNNAFTNVPAVKRSFSTGISYHF